MAVAIRPIPREVASLGKPTVRPERIEVIDAMRGLVLWLMALSHAALLMAINLRADAALGTPAPLGSWPQWTLGLVTHLAAPAFWTLGGVSIALLTASRRDRYSEWAITRFLLIRGSALILMDLLVFGALNGAMSGRTTFRYEFGILSSLGVAVALFSVARLLPSRFLGLLMVGLLLVHPWLVEHVGPGLERHVGFWGNLWLNYRDSVEPTVGFPVLGWCGLMGLGIVLGRVITRPPFERPRTWVAMGSLLLILWAVVRLGHGYGSLAPYDPEHPWPSLLIMNKYPPALDYLAFFLAMGAFVFAVLLCARSALARPPLRWLVISGQASLFFFVVHIPLYWKLGPLARMGILAQIPWPISLFGVWAIGLGALIPLARWYRQMRAGRAHGVLQYL